MKAKFDVVGLGVSPVDIISLVKRFPTGDGVQQAVEIIVQGGGPVATALVTLAKLGIRTAMLDVVSDDWRGNIIRAEFQQAGVCVDYLKQVKGCISATASILVRQADGVRAIFYLPGTVPQFPAAELPLDMIASAKILHINGRHFEACLRACHYARENGTLVSFDGGAHSFRPEMRRLVPLANICIVALDFATNYTGETKADLAAQILLGEGAELVVITDGERGSWVYSQSSQNGVSFHQPAYLLPAGEVVDTTGCGDSYHGAFLFGLLKEMSLRQTASIASATAALNSRCLGGRGGLPTFEQVSLFIEQWGKDKGESV